MAIQKGIPTISGPDTMLHHQQPVIGEGEETGEREEKIAVHGKQI